MERHYLRMKAAGVYDNLGEMQEELEKYKIDPSIIEKYEAEVDRAIAALKATK
jgi:hypothetical protein